MMPTTAYRLLALCVLIASMALGGCTDVLTSADDPALAIEKMQPASKFRHAHLLDRARGRSVGKDGNNGNHLGLIMRMHDGIQQHKVLERLRVLERYKVLERQHYRHVFNGLAVAVIDSLGLEDFEEFLALVEDDPDVEWFEPDALFDMPETEAEAPPEDAPWGLAAIGATEVDRREAPDVEIFVIDSGVSTDDVHVASQYDFTTGMPGTGMDADGHGTHIAGTIAGDRKGSSEGVVSRKAALHSLKVVGDDGSVELSAAIAAVEHVLARKLANPSVPIVLNFSLGATVETEENIALDEAVEAAIEAGVVVVVSAGNETRDAAEVSPAHVEAAITVGAYGPDNRFAWFSNHGPLVDILAPGVDVTSLGSEADVDPAETLRMSGTSMAAAHVTGAVALFLQENPNAAPHQVREALVATGQDRILGSPAGTTSRSVFVGTGGLLTYRLPPFYQFALMSGKGLKVDQQIDVRPYHDGAFVNASLFANDNLELERDDSHVEGFGYAGGDVKPVDYADATFAPRYNPTGLPGYHSDVAQIEIPEFDTRAFEHLASVRTDDDLELSGHVELGTYDAPLVWYVDGKFKTTGPTTFSGYGILLVADGVEIKHDFQVLGGPDESRLAIYTSGDFKVKHEEEATFELTGQFFTDGKAVLEGSFTLIGSLTAREDVELKDNGSGPGLLRYRRPTAVLTDLIWPPQP